MTDQEWKEWQRQVIAAGGCGARTRAGTPCKRRDIYASGRCRLHGGLSTGPMTKAGKVRSSENGFKVGWNKRTPSDASICTPADDGRDRQINPM